MRARDFTINAIAYNLRDETIIDPTEGGKDLRAKTIRACSPTSLSDDPVRILRAIRLAAAFDFHIEKNTRELMKQSASQLGRISPERLRDEIFKMLNGPKPDACMRALEMLGVLPYFMPELLRHERRGAVRAAHVSMSGRTLLLYWIISTRPSLPCGLAMTPKKRMTCSRVCLACGWDVIANKSQNTLPSRSMLTVPCVPCFSLPPCIMMSCKPETKTVEESGRIRFFDHDEKGAEVAAERLRSFNVSNDEVERVQTIIKNSHADSFLRRPP